MQTKADVLTGGIFMLRQVEDKCCSIFVDGWLRRGVVGQVGCHSLFQGGTRSFQSGQISHPLKEAQGVYVHCFSCGCFLVGSSINGKEISLSLYRQLNKIRKKKHWLFQLNTSVIIIMLVPCSCGSRGGSMGSLEPPYHTKALLIYVASYWAIIAYFLGFVRNCCGFVTNKTDCWLGSSLLTVFKHGAA